MCVTKMANMRVAAARWMKPAPSKPPKTLEMHARPRRERELERQPRQRQADEADDQGDVHRPLEPREPHELRFLRVRDGVGRLLRLQLAPHPEGPGQPEERVDAAHREGPDQEQGHPPEGEEEERVLVRVVVRRVGQVAGEAAGRPAVALLAGLDHVLAREVGAPGRRAAGCRARRGSRSTSRSWRSRAATPCRGRCRSSSPSTSLWHLPQLCMTLSLKPSSSVRRMRVRRMAVLADGQLLCRLRDLRRVDALLELLLDAVVAPSAGLRLALAVDARVGVRARAGRCAPCGSSCRSRSRGGPLFRSPLPWMLSV